MRYILNLLLSTIAVLIAAYLIPAVEVDGFFAALVAAIVIGLVNMLIKPILVIVTLPINIMTFGLFTVVINGALIALAAWIVPGLSIDGFWWGVLFAFVLSLVNLALWPLYKAAESTGK